MKWRAIAVTCAHCNALPGEHCISDGGRSRHPHAIRIARSNGLAGTPRSGHYTRPRRQVDLMFSKVELEALAKTLSEYAYEHVTGTAKPRGTKT